MFHIAYIYACAKVRKCPVSPSMISVTNMGLVILVMLSDSEPQVTENNPLLELSPSKNIKEFNLFIVIPYCVTLLIYFEAEKNVKVLKRLYF